MKAPPVKASPFLNRLAERAARPIWVALGLALAYMVLCSAYIAISGRFAAGAAGSVEQLSNIELLKGLAFVVVTGSGYFVFAAVLLRRIAAQQHRLARQQQALLTADSRAMAGIFAVSLAHDMRNMLGVALAYEESLKEQMPRDGDHLAIACLGKAIHELSALADRLMKLGRTGAGEPLQVLDLSTLCCETVRLAITHEKVRGCEVKTRVEEGVSIRGNASLVGRMLVNLILNAAEATAGTGRIEVRLRREGGQARIEVHDNGCGVPAELRQAIFEPFYSTKPAGQGLGLLSVRAGAIEHGGTVEVTESDLGGACFGVRIPVEDTSAREAI
jgi:signal transduction histidine kinase